ncbi:MAG: 2-dehydropantoate 2-reductase [Candidatus Hydrogenedentes bacterium]|nr:2-dehydropantoate 2-reductase [Candidatus Hydrogenedentota bacterium]
MKISVIGPGALGCMFAARLSNSGTTTTLIDHDPARAESLAESGLSVETASGSFSAKPNVSLEIPPKQNLILILTKAHATRSLKLPPNTPVLTLQNGLGNIETLCEQVGSANVLGGTTSEACTLLERGRVRHTASGITRIGAWTSCPLEQAAAALREAGFEIEVTDSPGLAIWEKVVISAGINPVTALLNVPNGKLLESTDSRQLLHDLVVEASDVASLEGFRFPYSLVERAKAVCRDTEENISSMLQDIRVGRRTEIDQISGEILRRGERAALPTPRTRVVWQLIKSLERS